MCLHIRPRAVEMGYKNLQKNLKTSKVQILVFLVFRKTFKKSDIRLTVTTEIIAFQSN